MSKDRPTTTEDRFPVDETRDGIRYEEPAPGVARVVLARAEQRNAQNRALLYSLNDAFDRAAQDDAIRVIVLGADGPHFSSGHDLAENMEEGEFPPVGTWGGTKLPGIEGYMAAEEELYFDLCWRWRNLPKPTIAQVHGKTIAGGLMLVWVCDLVIASRESTFADPVVAFGVNGVEYFAHPWEVGVRKAKEMLFTGEAITADEAKTLGMVNRVVERQDLEAYTLEMACHIALRPSMGLKLAKLSVNAAQDAQGFRTALRAAMTHQQLGHSNNLQVYGQPVDPAGTEIIRDQARGKPRFSN
jgi:enoyl-CoA hydratase